MADTGIGIPKSDQELIFEKFHRVYRPDVQVEGTGLGLSIIKELVNSYGGTISVESQVNKGSTFRVRLPIAQKGASKDES